MDENPYKAPVEADAAQELSERPPLAQPDKRYVRWAIAIGLSLFALVGVWRPDLFVKPLPFRRIRSLADCQRLGWNLTALCAASHHCLSVTAFATMAWGFAVNSRRITIIGCLLAGVFLAAAFALDFGFWPK